MFVSLQGLASGIKSYKESSILLSGLFSVEQDKTKLLAQVEAQESVICGLKAERKLWGQELAQQGTKRDV